MRRARGDGPPDLEAFAADIRSQWAVGMGLIRIGEGVNRIPTKVRERFPGQPWRQIVDMRNLAAHQYDNLQPRRVWRTVTVDVPKLRSYLAETVIPGLYPKPPPTSAPSGTSRPRERCESSPQRRRLRLLRRRTLTCSSRCSYRTP